MLDDRSKRERREERETADDEDDADHKADEQAAMRGEGAGRRRHDLLGDKRAGHRHHRNDDEVATNQHVETAGRVVPKGVSGDAGEGRAVISGLRRVEVQSLAESVRARIRHARHPEREHHRRSREAEHPERQHQDGQHGHLDLLRLDLLAEIFRRAADHETGDEHGDDDHQQHAVEA